MEELAIVPETTSAPEPKGFVPPAAATTAKSIILFSDGTGNSSGKLFKTNVWRLYEAVDLGPPADRRQRQIAYYDNGVGTSAFRPLAWLGGIFGFGLKRNVLEIYRYACRNYDPQSLPPEGSGIGEKGDHIYGFGFSRGAFTMRLVIALIADQGLVPYRDDADLRKKSLAAWAAFRRTTRRRAIRWIAGLFGESPSRCEPELSALGETPADPGERAEPEAEAAAAADYDSSRNHRPVIRMIGVWDTVAAYGGPFTEITRAIDNWIYPLSMPNYALHPRVRCARHALALDDERDSFWPLLWDEVAEQDMLGRPVDGREAPWLDRDRLQQVWFAGMHADVGGGYPDESLSYVSLLWMIEEAHRAGLRTVDSIVERYQSLANSFGPIHNSRSGLGSYYRYQPRRISALLAATPGDEALRTTLGLRDPDIGAGRREKGLLREVVVHESVVARIATGTDGYAPIVLPPAYRIVPPGGLAETAALETTGGPSEGADPQPRPGGGDSGRGPLLPDRVRTWLGPEAKSAIALAMERPWDLVWWRRVTYFLTVLATLALLTMPWWVGGILRRETADLQLAWDGRNLIGNIVRLPGKLLPDIAQRWVDTWANHSILFLFLAGSIAILTMVSARLERRQRDLSRAIWHACIPRIPPATVDTVPAGPPGHRPSALEKFRSRRAYQRGLQLFKWVFLPNFVFAPLLAGLLALIVLGIVTQAALPWAERSALLCPSTASPAGAEAARFDFHADALCNPAGLTVRAGERYLVTFDVRSPWSDGNGAYPTSPLGLEAADLRWFAGFLGVPLRRVPDARYLEPLAAVRSVDGGLSTSLFGSVPIRRLDLRPVEDRANAYQAEFEAPTTGELHLFANDSILLFAPEFFYASWPGRNAGTACVTVTPAGLPPTAPEARTPVCLEAARLPSVAKDPESPGAAGAAGSGAAADRPVPPTP